MPAPDSTIEEVRTSVLKYIRMYEEGGLTLGDLACELAVMAAAYDYAIGGIQDHWGHLLSTAYQYRTESEKNALTSYDDLERSLTEFRRAEAAW